MQTLHINGKKHQIEAEPDMPLLWAIRDVVGLKGTKYGCGKGLCGSCKILLDSTPIQSCLVTVSAAAGKKIITIEGQTKNLDRLKKSWIALNVPQCGFCQPGQLITASALLDKNNNPTDQEIEDAMVGNICRCGTYQRIKKAIHKVVAE